MKHTNPEVSDPRIRKVLAERLALIHGVQVDLNRKGFCKSPEMKHYYQGEIEGTRHFAEEIQFALDKCLIK